MTAPEKVSIILDDRSFEYDIYTLVIAFFSGTGTHVYDPESALPADSDLEILVMIGDQRVMINMDGSHVNAFFGENADRIRKKDVIKRTLYSMLREYTGRDLPWGDLTGIRPVKLAMEFLEEELSGKNADKAPQRAAGSMQSAYLVSPAKADLAVRIAQRERSILSETDAKSGYSLYAGIPFCPSICLYCSFSSSPLGIWEKRVDEYLDALVKEAEASRDCFQGRQLQSVYVGGGTPTTLSPKQMDRLLGAIQKYYDFSAVREFTVEAGRPDSITREKLQVLRDHKVSRISINPQTMNQKTLDLIGRHHTVEQTADAFFLAREMGFDNINMDLIVGLPGEGLEEVDHTMREVEKLNPDDITVHALALKRAARLALHMDEYEAISFQASDEIMERTEAGCRSLGMTPYYLYRQKNMAGNFENVGYAKSGKAGLYNILIMEEVQSILALGASGSTKIVHRDGLIERIENVKDVGNYISRIDEMIARKEPARVPGADVL